MNKLTIIAGLTLVTSVANAQTTPEQIHRETMKIMLDECKQRQLRDPHAPKDCTILTQEQILRRDISKLAVEEAKERRIQDEQHAKDWEKRRPAFEAEQRAETLRLSAYRPSDVLECQSRANAAFAYLAVKKQIMDDCLEARRLHALGQ